MSLAVDRTKELDIGMEEERFGAKNGTNSYDEVEGEKGAKENDNRVIGVREGARNKRAVSLCEVPEGYEKEDGGTRLVTKGSMVLKNKKGGQT